MSGVKVDVQWSPVEDNVFITTGSAITLYQVQNQNDLQKEQITDKRNVASSHDPRIVTLDSKAQPQMKHVAWYPKADRRNVFAVSQTNGRITITGLSNTTDDLTGKEFNTRIGQKSCSYLFWNPIESNFLAQGFDKNRNDPCILVWDVYRDSSGDLSERERSRHSFSEGPIVKPYTELGFGEGSSSFSWIPNNAVSFVTGFTNRHLRIYDLRDTTKPQREVNHRCIYGIAMDPLDDRRMASFADNQVAVWDLRSFDRPIHIISESKLVTKMCWCPTKLGVLSVLTKDSSYVKLHDIRHSLFGSDDLDQMFIERKIQPSKSTMSSFAWHPKEENRLMTVMPNGKVKDMVYFERLPVKWSSNQNKVMHVNKAEMTCTEDSGGEDVTFAVRKRLRLHYGQDPHNIKVSMKAVETEAHLHGLWKWLYNIRWLHQTMDGPMKRKLCPADLGVINVLRLDREDSAVSKPVLTNWKTSQRAKYAMRTMYRSEERELALQICGWQPDHGMDNINGFSTRSVGVERFAAMEVFHLAIDSALKSLGDSSMSGGADAVGDQTSLHAVAMALSGYTEEKNTLWQKTCGNLRTQLKNPYLRAIFEFLACDEDSYHHVLKYQEPSQEIRDLSGNRVPSMSVADQVQYALIYFSDAKLKSFLNQLVKELEDKGDLDGIFLTGLTRRGIDLMQRYVDLTSDVQTAAIAASFTSTGSVMKDARVNEWVEGYRDLLDRWKLWHERAIFDNVRQLLVVDTTMAPQMLVSCNFCCKSISSVSSIPLLNKIRSHMPSPLPRGSQNKPKVTCCPSCRKALPRCAICLTHMGTLSGVMGDSNAKTKSCPFDEWFSWCQTCRHGGHVGHMTEWFSEYSECPVTGCPCTCLALDSFSQGKRPVPIAGVKDEMVKG